MGKFSLAFSALILTALIIAEGSHDTEWESFKAKHGKKYHSGGHHDKAKTNFIKNSQDVEAHNKKHDAGEVSFRRKNNENSDIDSDEFHKTHKGLDMKGFVPKNSPGFYAPRIPSLRQASLPASFDWRNRNGVNAVTSGKHQGTCNSCWAFSTIGAIESQVLINGGPSLNLSEEALVDCYWQSCQPISGQALLNLDYWIVSQGGVPTEVAYPYVANTGANGACAYPRANAPPAAQITGEWYLNMPTDTATLQNLVMTYGPTVVAVAANAPDWTSDYSSGIIKCTSTAIDHAILLIGWGPGYWLIKNSWGSTWGDNGVGQIAMGSPADCQIQKGLAIVPTYNKYFG